MFLLLMQYAFIQKTCLPKNAVVLAGTTDRGFLYFRILYFLAFPFVYYYRDSVGNVAACDCDTFGLEANILNFDYVIFIQATHTAFAIKSCCHCR